MVKKALPKKCVEKTTQYRCLDCVNKLVKVNLPKDYLTIEDPRLGSNVGIFSLKATPVQNAGAKVTEEEIVRCSTCGSTNVQVVG